jgi:hypothetical protein
MSPGMLLHRQLTRLAVGALLAFYTGHAAAEDSAEADSLVSSWLAMVTRTQDAQPHWMTPLVTVTPRLEQEFRFDFYSEDLPNHGALTSYGASNRLEFVPTENTELAIGIPPYQTRTSNTRAMLADGWGDWPVFVLKYRLLSANEDHGNYIVSAFFQASAPVGNAAFTSRVWTLQPTIAFGKGWDDFDLQATISEQFPIGSSLAEKRFGEPVLVNVAAQFHLFEVLWPELELNSTWWPDGARVGKVQTFISAGVIFGRFRIQNRVQFILGAGYQVAVSPNQPSYRNNLIITARTTF